MKGSGAKPGPFLIRGDKQMKFFRIALPFFLLTGALMVVTPAGAAESSLDFRVAPAAGSELSEGEDYFVLDMEAGDIRTQAVEISNDSQSPLRVQLAAVDAATAQMGGVDYGAEEGRTDATGSWINLEVRSISLAPGRSTQVSFEVEVPDDATTGVHLAGLVIWVEDAEQADIAGAPASMSIQSRRVIAVQIDLPGVAVPALEIRGAHAEARPDGLYVGIDLFNAGTGFATGTGTVSIEGREEIGTFALDTVVPRTGTNFPFRWGSGAVRNGSYDVLIEIDYGVAIATWQGEVVVGPAVQNGLRGRGVEPAGTGLSLWMFVLVALVLIGVTFLIFRKRSFCSGLGSRLPRVSVSRPTRQSIPPTPTFSGQRPRVIPAPPAIFVPRSEEEQRRVPPPPPPPPPARPLLATAGYAGAVGASNFDY